MIGVEHLSRTFHTPHGSTAAVRDVSFSVPTGSITTILGPSGCGKTTTLRLLAGFERPDRGTIHLDDAVVFDADRGIDVPTHRRNVGVVFQSYAIWPHLDVAGNVGYPLRIRGRPRAELRGRVSELLHLVGLPGYERRATTTLSGGEQQRVALARSLAAEPSLLLLDEPLSNLDTARRVQMRAELTAIQQALGTTMLLVTHDRDEALSLSDHLIVMNAGQIVQQGAPRELFERPATAFVAAAVTRANLVPVTGIEAGEDGQARVMTPLGPLLAAVAPTGPATANDLSVAIRPDRIELRDRSDRRSATGLQTDDTATTGPVDRSGDMGRSGAPTTVLPGIVEEQRYLGGFDTYRVRVGDVRLEVTGRFALTSREVLVQLAAGDCRLLPAEGPDRPAARRTHRNQAARR